MTTVVAVRKNGQVAMAADALVTFGDTRLTHRQEANQKIFSIEDALSLIHISEPTRLRRISYAVFCLKKKR